MNHFTKRQVSEPPQEQWHDHNHRRSYQDSIHVFALFPTYFLSVSRRHEHLAAVRGGTRHSAATGAPQPSGWQQAPHWKHHVCGQVARFSLCSNTVEQACMNKVPETVVIPTAKLPSNMSCNNPKLTEVSLVNAGLDELEQGVRLFRTRCWVLDLHERETSSIAATIRFLETCVFTRHLPSRILTQNLI